MNNNIFKINTLLAQKVDYIIIGQGLAGTALSWELLQQGFKIHVINQSKPASSSMVAAGLYNPVTGHRMSKTWLADQLFPAIVPFYQSIEQALGVKVLYETGIYRPFISVEEANDWQGRASESVFKPYVKKVCTKTIETEGIHDPFGGLHLAHAGYVDTALLITSFQKWLQKNGMYEEGYFEKQHLQLMEETILYKDIQASKIIFCQGVEGNCTFFDWLPYRPVKGEIMDVSSSADFSFILNRGGFLVPKGNGHFRLGATYRWELTAGFEEGSVQELIDKISGVYKLPFQVVEKKWGIRPATKDRRPFIGLHPVFKTLGIFNGFGSKGVSLVPYFTRSFVNYLRGSNLLEESIDIQRYFSLYSDSEKSKHA